MRAPADKDPARSPLASGDSGVVELLDGTRITYRPIGPENAAALQRFHHRLSDRSVRLRFFRRQAGAHRQEGGYFTHVDGVNRFALVALDPTSSGEIVAVASFNREDETDRAEYAAAIVDSWQGPWPDAHPSPHLGRLAQERQGPHAR